MNIGVIGAGQVGLTFALLCEKSGYTVLVSDKEEDHVNNLNQSICLTNDPLVQKMLFEVYDFSATTNNLEVIEKSDIIFTFVSTPSNTDGSYDTSPVFEVANEFFEAFKLDIPVFNKKFVVCSTTNPGDVEQIQKKLSTFSIQVSYNPVLCSQPEIIKGYEESDIVLIGTEYQELSNDLITIYNKIQTTPVNAHVMSIKASEIAYLGLNSFLSYKINFANMMGEILTKSNLGVEIDSVLNAIGGDTRVGKKYLKYGFGFGGPFLPKHNRGLSHYAKELGMSVDILTMNEEFNENHLTFLKELYIKQNPDKSNPFVFNFLTYKSNGKSIEESQPFKLCIDLLEEGYYINVLETESISKQLSELSEQYDNRLKFYKFGTNPEGFKIIL